MGRCSCRRGVFPSKPFDPIFSQGSFQNKVTLSRERCQMSFQTMLKLTPGCSSQAGRTWEGKDLQAPKDRWRSRTAALH